MFFGTLLIILGALLLLNEIGIIRWSFWGYLWPILIIAIGVRMIVSNRQRPNSKP